MKLRILGDSLRLRLSKSDVSTFAEHGRVVETIHFGPGAALTYALEHADGVPALQASFEGTTIVVRMPSAMARSWAQTDQVSLVGTQPLGGQAALSVLVEKDFKCAIPRPGEEDYDGFAHPTGGC